MSDCNINQIFLGEVASVHNYGAFVKIPGSSRQGLVHRSQVSSAHVDDVTEVLNKGERIWCKVISINEDDKVALSMKLVNQGSGKDLDPNGVQFQLDEQKRKKMGNKTERKAIVLDAVFKTTCSKCKTPGHLSKDCFAAPDGKTYELLPEIEDEGPIFKQEVKVESKPKEKKAKKKSKKRKKSKSSKQECSDSEDDSLDEKSKKRKKKSKDKKHKKRKHQSSSSDSDSSDSSVSSYENKKHSKKCKKSKTRNTD